MLHPLLLALPLAVLESVTFYAWHWPHRHLLPERFRTMLMAKGVGKSVTYLLITTFLFWLHPWAGWGWAMGQPLVGVVIHVLWCRANGVDPIRVQPRERYVQATTAWVDKLIALEEARDHT